MEEEKQALGGLLVDTLNILLEFDPRWLDPKFGNQDERDYEFIDATHGSLGDVMLSIQDRYQAIVPDWEPPKLCPTCSLLDCENEGECEEDRKGAGCIVCGRHRTLDALGACAECEEDHGHTSTD